MHFIQKYARKVIDECRLRKFAYKLSSQPLGTEAIKMFMAMYYFLILLLYAVLVILF